MVAADRFASLFFGGAVRDFRGHNLQCFFGESLESV